MWSRVYFLIVMTFLFAACKTKQRVTLPSHGTPKAVDNANVAAIKTFELNNLDFHTFSGRAKTKIEMNKQVHDVTLHMRVQRDKAIWMSVTAILGVEVARVLITPDSVKIINKLQGEYIGKPFSYIYQYTNEGITFATLQDLLLANVSSNLLRTENVQVASASDEFIVVGIKDQLSFQYRINKTNRPFNFVLQEVGGSQNLEAFYSDFANTGGYNFPQNIALNIVGGDVSLKAQLNYNRVAFNEPVEMPFSVSARYKVLD
ncbi:uncharacterized protein DUF4292 [Sphingobacterium allocomposti]|jgi:hypothetical protein|uniref:Uncharacterized protein DUF4292 n=1 Tax=Sphingobacterium allocomposti TaxID=415956 RepID=A0A5S5DMY0_9SPHI|nr:DUF4292 domain-containing protein [Sphingobacterium composti Yoo et al. 2007 non Ten et al. 2007]TYP96406.1 uncharacterized protein DUF4292 [Sphingobacterium composti Yoo et al. 2007 non Ten et al. 2007]HLS95769.1 DUF4292 domain-containing protein [Sphingobacterium sp.]